LDLQPIHTIRYTHILILTIMNIVGYTQINRYVLFVVITIESFLHARLINVTLPSVE